MMLRVRNVGPNKATWTVEAPDDADPNAVARHVYESVISRRALKAEDISMVGYDAATGHGHIFVGTQTVGCFQREDA